ncbi:hypothetical protein G4G27_06555 [Sphingomonas sp. So64.6b]|uniref:hypothetical protein n=1 Tax=Sphingomonas sp. So64.6b TaxID=2997354 RepID=UPI001600A256|nr:hypothetical protein [Sphingomonas sp. So64.6b]QNA83692.1 hypothetical protein G4G27_06555 [Sphingomonas sp. So64.6b]
MPVLRSILILSCLSLLAANPGSRTITIENRTTDVLRGAHLSPTASDHWGPDRATENVPIGKQLVIALPGAGCRWDVRIILGDRRAEQIFRNRDLCISPMLIVDGTSGKFLRDREPARWN